MKLNSDAAKYGDTIRFHFDTGGTGMTPTLRYQTANGEDHSAPMSWTADRGWSAPMPAGAVFVCVDVGVVPPPEDDA